MSKANMFGGRGYHDISPFDRLKKYIFPTYPRLEINKRTTVENMLEIASEYKNKHPMVWIQISTNKIRDDFPWHYRPDGNDKAYIHNFYQEDKITGDLIKQPSLFLVPTGNKINGTIDSNISVGSRIIMYDIFMISYKNLQNKDNIYYMKQQRYPNIQIIEDVENIRDAYKKILDLANTSMVYIMDDNTTSMSHFNFDFEPPKMRHKKTAYKWKTRNTCTNLDTYSDGIRLLPISIIKDLALDTTGKVESNIVYQYKDIISFYKTQTSPIITWSSAFKSTLELLLNGEIKEANDWLTIKSDYKHNRFSTMGAKAAHDFYKKNKHNKSKLRNIHDINYIKTLMREFR